MNRKAQLIITDKDGNSVCVQGYAEACKHTGLANRTVLHLLRTGKQTRSGYTFDYDPSYVLHVCVPTKTLEVKHKVTGDTQTLVGWRTICEFFGVTSTSIRTALKNGCFREYFITEV